MKNPQDWIDGYLDDGLDPGEQESLTAWLKEDPANMRHFTDQVLFVQQLRGAVRGAAEQGAVSTWEPEPQPARRRHWLPWRSLAAAAAGLAVGLFFASPRAVATVSRLLALSDGGFEQIEGRIPTGFPRAVAVWSGDEADVAASPKAVEGSHLLRFLNPGRDQAVPDGRAISCDVFQLVDLRPLRPQLEESGDAVLEVSAKFLDAREAPRGSVTFTCQVFLFQGDPSFLGERWPENIGEAVASGSVSENTMGGTAAADTWKELSARCLVPAQTDFAVVQLAARANLRPSSLVGVYADDVRLSLKTQPVLPVRVVMH